MATFLFEDTIFGPVFSRRLGRSLGVNVLPNTRKVCNFNCIYCECGLTKSSFDKLDDLPARDIVEQHLENRLMQAVKNGEVIDTITFAGNGEPTLHPEFEEIIEDTIRLRNRYMPHVKIAVLSNSTRLMDDSIYNSLKKIDLNILKLDSVDPETIKLINCPLEQYDLTEIIEKLKSFQGKIIIQVLYFKGQYKDSYIDNSGDDEFVPWLEKIKEIRPEMVMLYTIARDTPFNSLEKISEKRLNQIARKIEDAGFQTSVSS